MQPVNKSDLKFEANHCAFSSGLRGNGTRDQSQTSLDRFYAMETGILSINDLSMTPHPLSSP